MTHTSTDVDLREPRTTFPDSLAEQEATLKGDPQICLFRESRAALAEDPYRPLFHFSPPGGHMNDPNGLSQWRGRYHLFYQRKPAGSGRMHWGHTVSDDLFHWRDLPLALHPDTEKDCYSGQTFVEADRIIAMYHGTCSGNAIATASDPLLLNWRKHPKNPVIPMPPPCEDGRPYRTFDPCVWKENDGYYYSLSGSYWDGLNVIDCRAVVHIFRSRDLAEWEYLGPLLEDGFHTEPGEDGATPNLLPIGKGKYALLLFSHKRGGRYYIGDYVASTHRFIPDCHGRMNYGPPGVGSLHAPSATIDDSGRLLAIFNVKEGKTIAGWDNIMSLPRVLSLNEDNSLRVAPVKEVESLRGEHVSVGPMPIPANDEVRIEKIRGKAMEIAAVIVPGAAREVGLFVFRSPNGTERTRVSFFSDAPGKHHRSALQIDVSEASLRGDVWARTPETGPMVLPDCEPLRLRIFIDRSVIEVFANERQCLTLRTYPERPDSDGVSLFARGAEAKLISLDAWKMRSVWPELKIREDVS